MDIWQFFSSHTDHYVKRLKYDLINVFTILQPSK